MDRTIGPHEDSGCFSWSPDGYAIAIASVSNNSMCILDDPFVYAEDRNIAIDGVSSSTYNNRHTNILFMKPSDVMIFLASANKYPCYFATVVEIGRAHV